MTGESAKKFHGVGIGPLSKILAVNIHTSKTPNIDWWTIVPISIEKFRRCVLGTATVSVHELTSLPFCWKTKINYLKGFKLSQSKCYHFFKIHIFLLRMNIPWIFLSSKLDSPVIKALERMRFSSNQTIALVRENLILMKKCQRSVQHVFNWTELHTYWN